jgi:hypothetical protein
MNRVVRARVQPDQWRKMQYLQAETGYTFSQLLRVLIDNAEVKSIPIVEVQIKNTGAAQDTEACAARSVA